MEVSTGNELADHLTQEFQSTSKRENKTVRQQFEFVQLNLGRPPQRVLLRMCRQRGTVQCDAGKWYGGLEVAMRTLKEQGIIAASQQVERIGRVERWKWRSSPCIRRWNVVHTSGDPRERNVASMGLALS